MGRRKAYTYGKGSMATVRNANSDVAHYQPRISNYCVSPGGST